MVTPVLQENIQLGGEWNYRKHILVPPLPKKATFARIGSNESMTMDVPEGTNCIVVAARGNHAILVSDDEITLPAQDTLNPLRVFYIRSRKMIAWPKDRSRVYFRETEGQGSYFDVSFLRLPISDFDYEMGDPVAPSVGDSEGGKTHFNQFTPQYYFGSNENSFVSPLPQWGFVYRRNIVTQIPYWARYWIATGPQAESSWNICTDRDFNWPSNGNQRSDVFEINPPDLKRVSSDWKEIHFKTGSSSRYGTLGFWS